VKKKLLSVSRYNSNHLLYNGSLTGAAKPQKDWKLSLRENEKGRGERKVRH